MIQETRHLGSLAYQAEFATTELKLLSFILIITQNTVTWSVIESHVIKYIFGSICIFYFLYVPISKDTIHAC